MERDQPPIIAKWHQSEELEQLLLGRGNSGEIHRKAFDTPEGERAYAYKEVASLEEAQEAYKIYCDLSEANLPVAGFMKIMTSQRDGEPVYALAMEDVTEGGKYQLLQVQMISDGYNNKQAREAIVGSLNPEQLALNMAEALAVMHSHGIYDYHPGLSYFLKVDRSDTSSVNFVILDYSNFTHVVDQGDDSYEQECRNDLTVLSYCLDDLDPDITAVVKQKYADTRAATLGALRNQPQNGTI